MNNNKSWMYQRLNNQGCLNPAFVDGLEEFMKHVISQPSSMGGTNIKCPCFNCKNRRHWDVSTVELLLRKGFVKDYYEWNRHGEPYIFRESEEQSSTSQPNISTGGQGNNSMFDMVMDVAGPNFDPNLSEEMPNPEAQKLYNLLQFSEQKLYDDCETSQLSAMARMLSLKSDHHWSEACFDQTSHFIKDILPENNTFLDSFYNTKKHMEGLGLPSIQIDCCVNGCMIYWGADIEMISCKFCSQSRYKTRVDGSTKQRKQVAVKRMIYFPLAPRLQRLYASPATAAHMRWHAEHHQENDMMRHCSDSEESKKFDKAHPSFSSEIRNVRLGLSTDGFQPFGQSGKQYSSWPITVTPYNLPPWMCLKEPYMFLSILVPGPKNPKQKIDVYLQPLIDELKMLWNDGVQTWDVSSKQNFQMQAALMWTISDFPAYSMLSGWKTADI